MDKYNSYDLMIKIIKDILLQYYEQFELSIADYKKKLDPNNPNERYEYECCVTRAETFNNNLRQIIVNLEKSIFSGTIGKETTVVDYYKDDGSVQQLMVSNSSNMSYDERLRSTRRSGIYRVLKQLSINPTVVCDNIYYAYMMLKNPNKIKYASNPNQFPKDMVYDSDNLVLNNLLSTQLHNGVLSPLAEDRELYDQYRKFQLDAKRTYAVIRQHMLDEKNINQEILLINEDEMFYDLFKDLCELMPSQNDKSEELEEELEQLESRRENKNSK